MVHSWDGLRRADRHAHRPFAPRHRQCPPGAGPRPVARRPGQPPGRRDRREERPSEARDAARRNRRFTHRAAARLVEQGVGQLPGIGTGIPTEPDPHRMVQDVLPPRRSSTPTTARSCRGALRSRRPAGPQGATDCTRTDVRGPGGIRPARPRRARQRSRTDPAPSSGEGVHAGVARVS
ncbi:SAM-dependent methyltransferase [Streptomyces pimonensis]|uniref:SAM-dependent methyltransferase n=1 Tax=Streptomyces pimonensis TaxID=2860288 RepID=A0ABV4ITY9_9ACTN